MARSFRWGAVLTAVLLVVGLPVAIASAAPGELDASFGGGGGQLSTYLGKFGGVPLLEPDGGFLVFTSDEHGGVWLRFRDDGNLEDGFGHEGSLASGQPGGAVYREAGGEFLVFGADEHEDPDSGVWLEWVVMQRFEADGTLDTSFGDNGSTSHAFGDESANIFDAAFGPNGRLYVVGSHATNSPEGFPQQDIAIAAYEPDGTPDTSFGDNGITYTDLGSALDVAHGVAVQPDGKIVVVGRRVGRMAVVRYNDDGSLDQGFGNGGVVVMGREQQHVLGSVLIEPGGEILAAGTNSRWLTLLRLDSDGTSDTDFGGGDGIIYVNPANKFPDQEPEAGAVALTLLLEPSGRFLIGGGYSNFFTEPTNTYGSYIARFNPNGRLDPSFGAGGVTLLPANEPFPNLSRMVMQTDGKILATGATGLTTEELLVVRLLGGGGPVPAYHRLTVTKAGGGDGVVVGGDIACDTECGGDYEAGETATLEVESVAAGSTFTGWSGACAGTGLCQVVMNGDQEVIAHFSSEDAGEDPSGTDGGESQGTPPSPPASGGASPVIPPTAKKRLHCRRGFKKKRVKGKLRCVRQRHPGGKHKASSRR